MTTVAFFDLDYTLLSISSGMTYVRESLRQRRVPLWIVGYVAASQRLGLIDFGQAHGRLIRYVGKEGQDKTAPFFAEWIPRLLFASITEQGRAKIAWHQQQGHRVVIISASIREIVQPVAEYLQLPDYLCTHLAVEDGRYTGLLDGPLCYGVGKVVWAKRWAEENGLPFPECVGYMYSDSASDVPLMELADHPIAVNPSRKLKRIAQARGWQIEHFY